MINNKDFLKGFCDGINYVLNNHVDNLYTYKELTKLKDAHNALLTVSEEIIKTAPDLYNQTLNRITNILNNTVGYNIEIKHV